MNVDLYAFVNVRNEYSQYPNDFTKTIFRKFIELSTTSSQIVIHRNQGIVYYGYVRRVDNGLSYVGFCVVANGAMFTCTERMLTIFADALTSMTTEHNLFDFHQNGDLIPLFGKLSERQAIMDIVLSDLKQRIDNQVAREDMTDIPQEAFPNPSNECMVMKVDEASEDVVKAVSTLGYVCVTKDQHYVSPFLANYQKKIEKYKAQFRDLNLQYDHLREKYERQDHKNKAWRVVLVLSIAIVVCFCAYLLISYISEKELSNTRDKLEEAQQTIQERENDIADLQGTVSGLKSEIKERENDIANLRRTVSGLQSGLQLANVITASVIKASDPDFMSLVGRYVPMIITDVKMGNMYRDGNMETDYGDSIYSDRTMYLTPRITYTGIREGEKITLYIRLYTPSGEMSTEDSSPSGYTASLDCYVDSGSYKTKELSGWGNEKMGNWKSGTYRYEFWYGGICLYSKTFTVY